MTPHDSTRCACGDRFIPHPSCPVHALPTEGVGAVDAAERLVKWVGEAEENDPVAADIRAVRDAVVRLREQVATLTADRDAWEVACHNATIEKHEAVARATPAEGAAVATLMKRGHSQSVAWDSDMASKMPDGHYPLYAKTSNTQGN